MNKFIISFLVFVFVIGVSLCKHNEDSYEIVQPPVDYLKLLPPECRECDKEGNKVADQIKSPESIRRIQEIVSPLCDYLGFFSETCKDLVTTHTAAIVQILLRFSNPYDSCVKLGLCPPTIPIPRHESKSENICSSIVYEMKKELSTIPLDQIIQDVSQRLSLMGGSQEMFEQPLQVIITGVVETIKAILSDEELCKLD